MNPCARLEKYPLDGAGCYGYFLREQIFRYLGLGEVRLRRDPIMEEVSLTSRAPSTLDIVLRRLAETTLGSVDVADGFTKREEAFLTEEALRGEAPTLAIRAGVRLGSLAFGQREAAPLR